MIVFGASLSPFVRKTLLFAAEKGLEVEHRAMMAGPDPDFGRASPFGKIPGFKDGDFEISDSSAIVAYMEKVKPDPELIPSGPKAHARAIWFDEYADTIVCGAVTPIYFNRIVAPMLGRPQNLEVADKAEKEQLPPVLDYLEKVAPENGYLLGDRLSLADISVGSVLINLHHLGLQPNPKTRPKAAAYADRVLARPAFARTLEAETAFLSKVAA